MSSGLNDCRVVRWVAAGVMALGGLTFGQQEGSEGPGAVEMASAEDTGGGAVAATRPVRARREAMGWRGEAPTEEEWRAIVDFMSRYSPNRLKAVEEHGASGGARYANLRKLVANHYRDLMAARDRGDEELYKLKLSVVQKDDEVWALQRQMREAADPDRPVLRWQLRQKITELVKLGLKERELRIARLEKALAEEKARLSSDQEQVTARIDERYKAMTAGMRSARPVRPGEGGGPGGTPSGATTSQVR